MKKRLDALQESKRKNYEMARSSIAPLRLKQVRAEILNTVAQVEDNTLDNKMIKHITLKSAIIVSWRK